jgi:hypothetical protein
MERLQMGLLWLPRVSSRYQRRIALAGISLREQADCAPNRGENRLVTTSAAEDWHDVVTGKVGMGLGGSSLSNRASI